MSQTPNPQAANDQSILVVDDHSTVRGTLSSILAAGGFSVTEASDVPSATAALETNGFRAIVTDLWMPGPSGLALVEEVERRGLRTPVILMSGSFRDLDPGDPRVDRLAGLLAKPLRAAALLGLVRAVTGQR